MDLVTQSLISSFRNEESLPDNLDESILFEHFVNYCAIANDYGDEFDVEDIHTGGGDDLGIDGLAIIVNGNLIADTAEIDDLATANKYLEVEIIFTQAKSGGNFTGSEISNFFFGVKNLFATPPALPRNTSIAEKELFIREIYKKSPLFKRGNPLVRMYYATNGKTTKNLRLE